MAREIERKFLVKRELWQPTSRSGEYCRQGYLSTDPERVVRVRVLGDRAFLTVKGMQQGIARTEFEYAIPRPDAETMLSKLCVQPVIEKIRFHETFDGHIWDVDDFLGANRGLVVAEIELPSLDAVVTLPPWVGEDVSDDPRYLNVNLARVPFTQWAHGP